MSTLAWRRSREVLELRPGRCLEVRRPGTPCGECRRACPWSAMAGGSGPAPRPQCSGCLACARLCPTGAVDVSPAITDAVAASFAEPLERPGASLTIACSPSARGDDGELEVECLGGCTTMLLLLPLAQGAAGLSLRAGDCERCPSARATSGLDDAVEEANRIAALTGLAGRVERVRPRSRGLWQRLFRPTSSRGGRGALLAEMRGRVRAALDESPVPAQGQGPPPSRERLRRLVLERAAPAEPPSSSWPSSGPGLPTGRLTLDDRCDACAACSRVCPTGALELVSTREAVTLRRHASRCVTCGTCADACKVGAITVDRTFDLACLRADEVEVLHRVEVRRCVVCGCLFGVAESAGPACAPCTRRYSPLDIESSARRRAEAAAARSDGEGACE